MRVLCSHLQLWEGDIDLPVTVYHAFPLSIRRLTKQWNMGASLFYGYITSLNKVLT